MNLLLIIIVFGTRKELRWREGGSERGGRVLTVKGQEIWERIYEEGFFKLNFTVNKRRRHRNVLLNFSAFLKTF